jgi:hypothetical protein
MRHPQGACSTRFGRFLVSALRIGGFFSFLEILKSLAQLEEVEFLASRSQYFEVKTSSGFDFLGEVLFLAFGSQQPLMSTLSYRKAKKQLQGEI